MPPVAKYSRQDFISKSLEIIKKEGVEKLTARELASAMEISVRPIFTAFKNMDEVKEECLKSAFGVYHSYFERFCSNIDFYAIGRVFLLFAVEEPYLFQFIFLKSQGEKVSFRQYMENLDDSFDNSIQMIQKQFDINENEAFSLYKNMWLYCNGIATLCVTGQCLFSEQEIEENLSVACSAFIDYLKKNKNN